MHKADIIAALGLEPHFEGGFFRAMFRATDRAPFATEQGLRLSMTSIYYMLTDDSPIDVFHTKLSDGIQYFHFGAPISYHLIHPDGRYEAVVLGPDLDKGQVPALAVKGGVWKAAELPAGEFGLVSEVVSPGWDMADMRLIDRAGLTALFPQHAAIIGRLGAPKPLTA
ncbi:MAG: cupin domain-containing protein [Devosia sp.]|nr:cupin domain-containing protein [Devosia sp.]